MEKVIELGCSADWQAIIGISSIVVALLALFFTVFESRANKKERVLSVQPGVGLSIDSSDIHEKLRVSWELFNSGIGPCIIESMVWLNENGEAIQIKDDRLTTQQLGNKLLDHGKPKSFTVCEAEGKHSILVGERKPLISVKFHSFKANNDRRPQDELHDIRIRIIYSDIYSNRWHSEYGLDGTVYFTHIKLPRGKRKNFQMGRLT
ncbi:hypothetical protein [Gilvimarinus sp. 1_MG-2023]|uniref:hypothetical protein n=1 Tax=Gilvimarinus sp. 1_MG-2023 TaxID=3062638 RepID=UPI0026E3F4DB|nr:hypothetical protein [Gilvimarinus sp. 1_MG-2023]MDO6747204.1 hypothetical protein [Gilvimarinus sp. 1_MG-2023]